MPSSPAQAPMEAHDIPVPGGYTTVEVTAVVGAVVGAEVGSVTGVEEGAVVTVLGGAGDPLPHIHLSAGQYGGL